VSSRCGFWYGDIRLPNENWWLSVNIFANFGARELLSSHFTAMCEVSDLILRVYLCLFTLFFQLDAYFVCLGTLHLFLTDRGSCFYGSRTCMRTSSDVSERNYGLIYELFLPFQISCYLGRFSHGWVYLFVWQYSVTRELVPYYRSRLHLHNTVLLLNCECLL
jgi:hypothetical protein